VVYGGERAGGLAIAPRANPFVDGRQVVEHRESAALGGFKVPQEVAHRAGVRPDGRKAVAGFLRPDGGVAESLLKRFDDG